MTPLLPLFLFLQAIDLTQPNRLDLVNATAQPVTYKGKSAIRITQNATQSADTNVGGAYSLAILRDVSMENGEIEIELAGEPGPGANVAARGFVGVGFRVADPQHMEVIYLRPTNGRADDQVRRNHSVQYESLPDFPWSLLREKFPKMYETYVDLEPAVWTRVRITFEGSKARLYVHDAAQPTLIVNDLKRPVASGKVALWVGPGTIAHFRGLKVTKR